MFPSLIPRASPTAPCTDRRTSNYNGSMRTSGLGTRDTIARLVCAGYSAKCSRQESLCVYARIYAHRANRARTVDPSFGSKPIWILGRDDERAITVAPSRFKLTSSYCGFSRRNNRERRTSEARQRGRSSSVKLMISENWNYLFDEFQ